MLNLNKYVRELGYNEESFPFKKENKDYYVNKDGFINAEFYDLSHTFALTIYSHLCYFKEYTQKFGYPAQAGSMEKWLEILDRMIEAFKLILTVDTYDLSKKQIKKIRFGLRMFTKYYFDLWT